MYLLFIVFLAAQHSMWDLCLLTRDRPMPPAVEVWSLNHWTTRKVLLLKEYWEIPPYIVGLSSPQENNKSSQYIWSISSVLNTYYLI